jgi:Secretion system C-terminal sorting domain
MRKIQFLLLLFVTTVLSLNAQKDRFLKPIFTKVNVQENVTYGKNVSILPLILGKTAPKLDTLTLDIYSPDGDASKNRPLIVYLGTGNFLPVRINGGVTGMTITATGNTKPSKDSIDVELATRLAKHGYVVAVASYRMGWNPTAATQPERAEQLIVAAYRGFQDLRTAVRFFKMTAAEQGNPYGLDTTRVTAWGNGTGGYVTLGGATLDSYAKILNGSEGKFIKTGADGKPIPMIIESVHGDVEAKKAGVTPTGVPLCIPNHIKNTSKYQLNVNMSGALGDTMWIDPKQIPMISFHTPTDPYAPYKEDVLVVPTTQEKVIKVQGAYLIQRMATAFGNNDVFVKAGFNDTYSEAAKKAATYAGHEYLPGLMPLSLKSYPKPAATQSSPWNWWNSDVWNKVKHGSCGTVEPPACSYDYIGKLTNVDMSATKGRLYADTIVGFFLPRAYAALNLAQLVKADDILQPESVQMSVVPNPANEYVMISSATETIQRIQLYDINGAEIMNTKVNSSYFAVYRNGLPAGMYIARVQFDKGVVAQKVIFE